MESEDFAFAPGLTAETDWDAYCASLQQQRAAIGLPSGWVPSTFLVAEIGGRIVGRTSIRHRLTERLAQVGGHIGFCVLPTYRRRGYATEILRQSLVISRKLGLSDVLITCDAGNVGSTKVIESCGAALESVVSVASGRESAVTGSADRRRTPAAAIAEDTDEVVRRRRIPAHRTQGRETRHPRGVGAG